jgi:general stress protein YciG
VFSALYGSYSIARGTKQVRAPQSSKAVMNQIAKSGEAISPMSPQDPHSNTQRSAGDENAPSSSTQRNEGHRDDSAAESTVKPRRPRGFAAMDRKLVSEIARKGGKAAHTAGTAHEFTAEEARDAGRKGGRATHAKRRALKGDVVEAAPESTPSDPTSKGSDQG